MKQVQVVTSAEPVELRMMRVPLGTMLKLDLGFGRIEIILDQITGEGVRARGAMGIIKWEEIFDFEV